jgi:hypothetical protein
MNILLVTFDLTGPSGAYRGLFEALKKQGRWWHYMKPTWLIYTDKTPNEVVDALRPHIKGRGRMLVTKLRRPYQGLLPNDAWEWIRRRIDSTEE